MYTPKYQYQSLKREQTPNGRRYLTPDGLRLPSVTTILDATKSEESRDAIRKWQQRVGVERARQITTEAANRGTRLHTYLERWIKDGAMPPRGGNPWSWASWDMAQTVINQGLKNVGETYGTEIPLYFPEIYAGTTDCCGIHLGVESIIDFKQTNKPKKREWIDDYFYQLVAYGDAHNALYNTNIKKGVIMMCVKPEMDDKMNIVKLSEYQEFIIQDDIYEYYRVGWWKKVEQYYLMNQSR